MTRMVLVVAASIAVLSACGESEDPTGSGGDGADDAAGGNDQCVAPTYSGECAEVGHFECGFMASCTDGVIRADWHVHIMCPSGEQIANYQCEHVCPEGCATDNTQDWPQDGAQLVADLCGPGGGGSAGSGGMAGSGGSAGAGGAGGASSQGGAGG